MSSRQPSRPSRSSGRSPTRQVQPDDAAASAPTAAQATDQDAASKQGEQLKAVLMEMVGAELAAVSAAVKFWAGWADAAERYVEALSTELTKVNEGSQDTGALVGRLSDMTRSYLRSLVELPDVAVRQFNQELGNLPRPRTRPVRAARVKD
jgi:hypothetical protein